MTLRAASNCIGCRRKLFGRRAYRSRLILNTVVAIESSGVHKISYTDDVLVRKCVNGDEEAWSILIDRYKSLIFSIAIKYEFSREDADEIFQDVCLTLLEALPELRKPRALPAWLIQTTSHRCFHWKRERRRYVGGDPDEAYSAPATVIPANMLAEIEREQMLRDALSELAPRCLALVHMLFFQEPALPYEQVAKKLNVAAGSIGFIRMRCLKRLRQILEKSGFR
jgi:RNA polymerase sigma factor (sigma-70 family)